MKGLKLTGRKPAPKGPIPKKTEKPQKKGKPTKPAAGAKIEAKQGKKAKHHASENKALKAQAKAKDARIAKVSEFSKTTASTLAGIVKGIREDQESAEALKPIISDLKAKIQADEEAMLEAAEDKDQSREKKGDVLVSVGKDIKRRRADLIAKTAQRAGYREGIKAGVEAVLKTIEDKLAGGLLFDQAEDAKNPADDQEWKEGKPEPVPITGGPAAPDDWRKGKPRPMIVYQVDDGENRTEVLINGQIEGQGSIAGQLDGLLTGMVLESTLHGTGEFITLDPKKGTWKPLRPESGTPQTVPDDGGDEVDLDNNDG